MLGSRLFDAYRHAAALQQRGVDVALRMNGSRKCDFDCGRRLGVTDHVVIWKRPPSTRWRIDRASYDALPEQIQVRVPALRGPHARLYRVRQVTLVTTLCDAEASPKDDLAERVLARLARRTGHQCTLNKSTQYRQCMAEARLLKHLRQTVKTETFSDS